jgi:hypothetical protein
LSRSDIFPSGALSSMMSSLVPMAELRSFLVPAN